MEAQEIFTAAREGNGGEVKRLLDADPTLLERVDVDGDRPLIVAASYGQLEVVRLLMEIGANLNATGSWGDTALICAATRGHVEVTALLLSKGAHANSNDGGVTPLMLACRMDHLGVVKILVQHMAGQGLDERDSQLGWTALHGAAFKGHEEVVRFVLLAGADPTVTDDEGRTPRAVAEQFDRHPSRVEEGPNRCIDVFKVI
jgi:ankyrin repeat protein